MNRIKSMIVVFAAALLAVSCDKETPVVEYLDVTPNNISGQWQLVKWNGSDLSEGSYYYMDLVRKETKFTIYQNFDSMADMPHVVTGEFSIETDAELGAVISGMYDYDEGFWAHKYIVRNLTKDSMEWIASDDPSFVQEFVRVSEIPTSIKQ